MKEMQIPTMVYGRRPFGVGLLIAGYDVSLGLLYRFLSVIINLFIVGYKDTIAEIKR